MSCTQESDIDDIEGHFLGQFKNTNWSIWSLELGESFFFQVTDEKSKKTDNVLLEKVDD